MKSLVVYHRYVKMPRCRCEKHGLEYITFYVQKHIANLWNSLIMDLYDPIYGSPSFVLWISLIQFMDLHNSIYWFP